MDLELTDDQRLLIDTASRFIADQSPLRRLRELAAEHRSLDAAEVRRRGEIGWYAAFVDEKFGGGSVSGYPIQDVAALSRLRGSLLQPEPFIGPNVAAAVLQAFGSDEQRLALLPGLADGSALVTIAVGSDASWGGRANATRGPAGWSLDLAEILVADIAGLTHVLVAVELSGLDPSAQDPEVGGGIGYFVVPIAAEGVQLTPLGTLDITQPLQRLTAGALLLPSTALIDDPDAIGLGTSLASVLVAAETCGAMATLFELTRTYALQRIAFGRPIGSFQAIKHMLADISVVLESAEAVTAGAVRAVDSREPYAGEVASIARVFLGEHAVLFAEQCLQIFGGIGFTWEHDLHLYLRRFASVALLYGTTAHHRNRILSAHRDESQGVR